MINPDSPDRAEILTARLRAWHLSGEQVPEIFADAHRRFALVADTLFDDPLTGPGDLFLTCFEEALDAYDVVLTAVMHTWPPEWAESAEEDK
jgi:hypothetical protein